MADRQDSPVLRPSIANVQGIDVEVLEGARAVTAMQPLDFAASIGLTRRAVPRPGGGMRMGVCPGGKGPEIMLYGIVDQTNKVLVGLRTDFEKLGLWYGRVCDALDKKFDHFVTG